MNLAPPYYSSICTSVHLKMLEMPSLYNKKKSIQMQWKFNLTQGAIFLFIRQPMSG